MGCHEGPLGWRCPGSDRAAFLKFCAVWLNIALRPGGRECLADIQPGGWEWGGCSDKGERAKGTHTPSEEGSVWAQLPS